MITKLIIEYHLPEVSICFKNNDITSDIYITSWYITMFSSKMRDVTLLYMFWLSLIERDDSLYVCYFGVALLQMFRADIQSQDMQSFPNVFKKIMVSNIDVLMILLNDSDKISENTPDTAKMVLKKYNMFSLANTDSFVKILERAMCLMVLPREILQQTYPHDMVCECGNQRLCHLKKLSHVLLDCRPVKEQKMGYFPNSHLLGKGAQKSQNKLDDYPKKFMPMRRNTHITLMGNQGEETEILVQQLYASFIKHDFPYISVVDGGYSACHDFAVQHNYPISSHNPKKCLSCNGENKVIIESTLDNFFRLNSLTKKNSVENSPGEDMLKTEKVFLCKLTEDGNINTSDLGLVVTPTQILLYSLSQKVVLDVMYINKLLKVTSSKNRKEILNFSFSDGSAKKVFILDLPDINDFMAKVRENFRTVKKMNSNIKSLI